MRLNLKQKLKNKNQAPSGAFLLLLWYNYLTEEKVDKHKKLRDIQSRLLGIELDLDLIEQDLEEIISDINYLFLLDEETAYNINLLKQDGIVADLKSYKQSWQKLVHIRSKSQELEIRKIALTNKLNQKILSKEYYDREWDILHREMEDNKVILVFKKRKDET